VSDSLPAWAAREDDEPLADWMLRIEISSAAVAGLIRIPRDVPAGRNIPAGLLSGHTINWPDPERASS